MKIDNLITHVATGETDNSFVGIKILGNQIHFYYPESYHFDNNNFDRDDFLDLLKTISIAKTKSNNLVDTYNSRKENSECALLSYIWIIEDYFKNGLYMDSERIFKSNQRGKINWKKTLQQQQPIITGGNIIYSDLIVEVKSPRNSILVEAHKFCVKKSLTLIGWIYGIKPDIIETISNSEKMVPMYLEAIHSELNNTFDDIKYSKLIHMENVLIGLDESIKDNNIIYGVDSYEYIFERMIDRIFSTEKTEDYYPNFTWHLLYPTSKYGLKGPTIRPDTILKSNNDIFIIDAKFYRYGSLNLSKTKGLPEAASIVKQITYGAYIQSRYPDNNIYNIFILPYDSKSNNGKIINQLDKNIVHIGEVSSEWKNDKTHEKVYTFLIDLKYVIKTWNRIIHEDDKKRLINMVRNNLL